MIESPQLIRQRRLLLKAPLLAVPLITLLAWTAGVGKGSSTQKTVTPVGVNTQLPGPQLPKNRWMDKMGFYEKADQDSQRVESHKNEDRIAMAPPARRDSSEIKVYQSLDRLQAALHAARKQPLPYGQLSPSAQYAQSSQPPQYTYPIQSAQPPQYAHPPQYPAPPPSSAFAPAQVPKPPPDSEMLSINSALDKMVLLQQAAKDSALARKSPRQPSARYEEPPPKDPWADTSEILEVSSETDGVLTSGVTIALRLQEEATLRGVVIPRNTLIYGTVALENERLHIRVRSIRCGRMICPVSLEGYDLDGQPGIYVPGSMSRDVSKESADEALEGLDPGTVDPSVGAQATSAGIRAVKSLLSKKVRQVRVFVRPGYHLLLK